MMTAALLLFAIPPAVKTLAMLGFVYAIVQILKQSTLLAPYIVGWVAIALNAVLSGLGLLVVIPPAQLYDLTTLGTTFTVWLGIVLGAAGLHGTVKALSPPTVLATMPGSMTPVKVPAVVVPLDPTARVVAKS
jgi:hypothetical protein